MASASSLQRTCRDGAGMTVNEQQWFGDLLTTRDRELDCIFFNNKHRLWIFSKLGGGGGPLIPYSHSLLIVSPLPSIPLFLSLPLPLKQPEGWGSAVKLTAAMHFYASSVLMHEDIPWKTCISNFSSFEKARWGPLQWGGRTRLVPKSEWGGGSRQKLTSIIGTTWAL